MACRLRTSLCLQFKPHHIAAGAIFLAAKFLKVKLPSDGEKNKRDRRQGWSKSENLDYGKDHLEIGDEGEMLDDTSPMPNSRKRKGGSPLDRQLEGKKRHDYVPGYNHDSIEDGHRMSRVGYPDREHRRHSQENHL